MIPKEHIERVQDLLENHGPKKQLEKLEEELLELIEVVNNLKTDKDHGYNNKKLLRDATGEIADVLIMVYQITMYLELQGPIDTMIEHKMERTFRELKIEE